MMKRVLSLVIILSMLLSLLTGCSSVREKKPSVSNDETSAVFELDEESNTQNTNGIEEESGYDDAASIDLAEYDNYENLRFTGLSDEKLLPYIEDTVYTQLIKDLNSSDYFIEDVSAVYVSQEYLQELAYNSQTNIFFGYSLKELDAYFEGTRYVFALGDDGNTSVEALQVVEDTTYEQIIKNVAIGAGVILICVTVSYVTAGLGAPAVSVIFSVAAKTGAACALSGLLVSGVSAAVVKGYQTGDINEAIKAGALGASEGFKWGAISGTLSGGAREAWGLYSATKNGLTLNQVAIIQKESGYPLSLIRQFHTVKEYTVFKNAGLQAEMLAGKLTLVRSDIDLYNVFDEYGRNNYTRLSKGLNPIDSTGKAFEWHHIGQKNDATLSLLTSAEHDNGALHEFKVVSEIDRNAFNSLKKDLNKALLKWLLVHA